MSDHESTRAAYTARASEYAELLGSVGAMSPLDRDRIAQWARSVRGSILDAGCGPGHWTAFMRSVGADASGIDLVPAFVALAQERFVDTDYRIGSVLALPHADSSLGGVLAWYSLIHMVADDVGAALREFARALRPGGSLLIGFFEGPEHAPFAHAVTPAYFWPISRMEALLHDAGFEVESTESRTDPGSRPHASIVALASDSVRLER